MFLFVIFKRNTFFLLPQPLHLVIPKLTWKKTDFIGWLSLSNLLPGFVDFIVKFHPPPNISICLTFASVLSRILIIHFYILLLSISYLICPHESNICHKLQKITLEMKWQVKCSEYKEQRDFKPSRDEKWGKVKYLIHAPAPHILWLLPFNSNT